MYMIISNYLHSKYYLPITTMKIFGNVIRGIHKIGKRKREINAV